MEKRYEDNDGDNGSVLMMFLFICLLIVKAMDFEISWWIVTSPMWASLGYLTLVGFFNPKRDS